MNNQTVEQGINWISTKDTLPAVDEYVLILLESETFLKGRLKRSFIPDEKIWVAFFLDGENVCTGRDVTHFAYIDLPQTANPQANGE